MTGYNPAHYRAEGDWEITGAFIYCTQCTGEQAEVFVIGTNADDPNDPQTLDVIINATRQHHDDHHEGK